MGATADELATALAAAVSPRGVVSISRRPHAYQSSHQLDEITVVLDTNERIDLLAKDLHPTALLPAATRARVGVVTDPYREAELYRLIVGPEQLDAPVWYGTAGTLLLLERVHGRVLWQVGDPTVWCDVARSLARLHDLTAARLDELAARAPLLRDVGDALSVAAFARALARLPGLSAIEAAYQLAARELAALPKALLHGEAYPSNILVRGGSEGVAFIDWETAKSGPPLLDLAALAAGWDAGAAAELVAAYRGASASCSMSDEAFDRAFVAARLHVAIGWLGHPAGWSSQPIDHAHDWYAESLELAKALG